MENYNNMNPNGNQQSNQTQYGSQQSNQTQYNYQQPNQTQYNYQQPNQTQYNYQQPNQTQYNYQQSYQQMQYVDQSSSQPVNQQKKDKPGNSSGPKKKTGLIVAIIVIFAVLIIGAGGAAIYFYMTAKKNKDAASTIASEFIKAYGYYDSDKLQGYFPKRLKKEDEIVDFIDEARYDGMRYFDYTIKDIEVTDAEKYSVETAEKDVSDAYEKHLDIKDSYSVSVKYTETYEKDGETVENSLTDSVICGKIDDQWYVLDPALISKKNQIITDFENEADDGQSMDVVEKLMTCVTESDVEEMDECFAAIVRNSVSMKDSKEALNESFDKLDEFGITFTVGEFSVSKPEEYDVEEAKESVKKVYGTEPDFNKCRKFTADYSVTIEADGESTSKDVSEDFICGKEDGNWYIYNSDIVADHNALFSDIIDEKETERDEEEVRTTINAFVEALALLDVETIKSYMPDAVLNDEETASSIEKLESQKTEFDSYGVVLSLDSVEIGTLTKENTGALMIEVMLGYENAVLYIEKAYSTTVTFGRSASYRGRTESDEITSDMICARIEGKWYIIHADTSDDE
ncbi:hypothetical protein SAMN02910369_02107 [Lachnospiraceae bacterium NE2001]|nr:hypothetical protein SAMN02910369_02107 [Lachnospiraceae bacterium NE2001]